MRLTRGILSFSLPGVVAAACIGNSSREASARLEDSPDLLVAQVAQLLGKHAYSPACGTTPVKKSSRVVAIAATTNHCATCWHLGYRLRMLDSLAAEEGIPGLLLTLDEDTADICAFTRAQRVPVMVVSVADTAVPQLRKSKDPLFLLAANGVAETFQFLSKDNAELLSVSAETRR